MRVALVGILATTFLSSAPASSQTTPPESALLTQGKPIERQISGKETHSYRISAAKGQFITGAVEQRGVDVIVTVLAPNGKSLSVVDSPNGDQGDEPFSIVAGASGFYRIEVKPFDSTVKAGRYSARLIEVLSARQYQARLAEERQRVLDVSRWLAANAIPLTTVAAGQPTKDLQPLKTLWRDVRIVGLGEATHGTREFFQAKHRLLEFLVTEMGFRTFAIEATQSGSEVIDDYVMGRISDGEKALDGQGFWTWNTEEVRDMLEWMRSYNRTATDDRKVRFVGYDLQLNERGYQLLLAYLLKVAPDHAARLKSLPLPTSAFAALRDTVNSMEAIASAASGGPETKRAAAAQRVQEMRSIYYEILGHLALNEAVLTRRSSAQEFSNASRYAQLILQYLESYAPSPGSGSRDEYMAENIVRIADAAPSSKIVVWAHNGHIERAEPAGDFRSMGNVLGSIYGHAYYALGFSFNQGSFQARSSVPEAKFALTSFTVGPAAANSFDWQLAHPRIPMYIIDFRNVGGNASVSKWLSTIQTARSFGAVYPQPDGQIAPARQFDGMLFIDKTTRARPNPNVPNVAREPPVR